MSAPISLADIIALFTGGATRTVRTRIGVHFDAPKQEPIHSFCG
jgi:hypothetical protein